jgi:HD-GYP domain-containing protein (c-di-GMP phosphodiesterase class II)
MVLDDLIARTNRIAAVDSLPALLNPLLALCCELAEAERAVFYLSDQDSQQLVMLARWQNPAYLATETLENTASISPELMAKISEILAEEKQTSALLGSILSDGLILPLFTDGAPLGAIHLIHPRLANLLGLNFVTARLAPDIHKLYLLQASQDHAARLESLVGFLSRIGSSLDPSQILRQIIQDASQLLNTELSSLFLLDEGTEDLILKLSTRQGDVAEENLHVPSGRGIIGYVVKTGETTIVDDVQKDERHYQFADQMAHLNSRSMIAVPLRARTIQLGSDRGASGERIIGGLEAINKQQGTFNEMDATLLVAFASQAATVLQIANLYQDANQLFLDVIRALAAAIDAKDPYTQGHSQRVSDLSVLIASNLGLDSEMVHHIRVGSMMHDVGKIGIPDHILAKPEILTEDEYAIIKQHPDIGERIVSQVHLLREECAAIHEHHERLDGSGYPHGLKGDQISQIGRIVAVADVYDALTSDRPYRTALPKAEVLEYIRTRKGSHFDPQVVEIFLNVMSE